ncbi:hypothetical protein DFH09DRAFT_288741 [Mycena vulgaris]|nr:hypothetical protein DFH09DRAFT_288741 [Mycena vulgaris]
MLANADRAEMGCDRRLPTDGQPSTAPTGGQPSEEITRMQGWPQWQQPHGGAVGKYSDQDVKSATSVAAMVIVMDWKPSQTRAPYKNDGPAHASTSQKSSSGRSAAPDPPRRKRKRPVPPNPVGPDEVHIKKTSHSEAERKAALEKDPWTLVVEPTKVVCRGCKLTVRLDRRSRYYPGLWHKHRDRCEDIKDIKHWRALLHGRPNG